MLLTKPAVAFVRNPLAQPAPLRLIPKPEPKRAGHAWAGAPLLDVDLRASFFELLLDGGRFVLGHAFLHGLLRPIDEVLGFF